LIQVNITVVYLTFKWPFSELHFRSAFNFRSSFHSVRLRSF